MIDMIFSGRNLFVLFILLAGNFLQPLLPCNTSRVIQNSSLLRHLVGFFTLMYFVVVTDTELDHYLPFGTLMATTVVIYGWFMLAAKMTVNWWLILVMLLGALYFINLYEDHNFDKLQDKNVVENIRTAKDWILILSLIVTAIGFILYVGEKKLDYRSKFCFSDFFFSTSECKNTPNVQSYSKSFQAAFFDPPGVSGMRGGGIEDELVQGVIEDNEPKWSGATNGSNIGLYNGIPLKLPEGQGQGGGDPWSKEATPVSSV